MRQLAPDLGKTRFSSIKEASCTFTSHEICVMQQKKMILEEENVCPHIHEQIWVEKCAVFEPEVGKRVICDVKFAYRKNL